MPPQTGSLSHHQDRVQEYEDTITALWEQRAVSSRKREALHRQCVQLKAELNELHSQLFEQEQELGVLRKQVHELTTDREVAPHGDRGSVHSDQQRACSECPALLQQVDHLRVALEELRQEKSALHNKLTRAEDARDRIHAELIDRVAKSEEARHQAPQQRVVASAEATPLPTTTSTPPVCVQCVAALDSLRNINTKNGWVSAAGAIHPIAGELDRLAQRYEIKVETALQEATALNRRLQMTNSQQRLKLKAFSEVYRHVCECVTREQSQSPSPFVDALIGVLQRWGVEATNVVVGTDSPVDRLSTGRIQSPRLSLPPRLVVAPSSILSPVA